MSSTANVQTHVSSATLEERYLRAIKQLHKFGASVYQVPVKDLDDSLPFFSVLPKSEKQRLVLMNEETVTVVTQLIRSATESYNEKAAALSFLTRSGLQTTVDAFVTMKADDIIEVYSAQGHNLFSGLISIAHSGYSLEELQSRPWQELWYRDPLVTQKILDVVTKVVSSPIHETAYMPVARHEVYAKGLGPARSVWVCNKVIAPVWNEKNETIGFICANEMKSDVVEYEARRRRA